MTITGCPMKINQSFSFIPRIEDKLEAGKGAFFLMMFGHLKLCIQKSNGVNVIFFIFEGKHNAHILKIDCRV